jgi:hypothetical protein
LPEAVGRIAISTTRQRALKSKTAPVLPRDERLVCYGCGQVHPEAKLVRLPDGREVGTYSEEYRRYHEALWVLKKKRSKRTRIEYLEGVREKRGLQAKEELREEMLGIWQSRQE